MYVIVEQDRFGGVTMGVASDRRRRQLDKLLKTDQLTVYAQGEDAAEWLLTYISPKAAKDVREGYSRRTRINDDTLIELLGGYP